MSETGEIDLAREPEFRLGRLRVIPSLREIRINGRTEIIEPKVMQVLVALFRADGGVLSRDLLIERCWGGRIVGEDAINRCIAKVRKVAELDGNCSFAVETVARVGYRMIRSNESAELGENAGLAPKDKERTPRSAWASRVALGMGGLALAAFAWRVFQPEPEWTIDRFQMLVSSPYLEDQPAIAPNGTMIAYAATTADGVRSIFIRNLTEGEPGRLTDNHDVDEHSPAWSPQSDRIAFVRYVPGKPCTILIKPVPAGTVQEAAHCLTNEDTRLAWGADGALYFADQPKIGQTSRIVRLDLATGKRRDVTHPDPLTANDKEPSISPDGHMLAFYRDQYPHSGIFVTDLTTGKERKVTPDRISVWGDGWTSDSRSLIVGTLEPDEPALWAYHIDGRPAQRLTFNQQEFGRVVGGPNDLEAVEVYTTRMSVVAAEKRGEKTLLEQNSDLLDLDIAPDGSLVFVAYGAGGVSLTVKHPEQQPQRIASFKQLLNPHWSPDGTRIAFATVQDGRSKIGVIRSDGSARTTVADMAANAQASAPVWSRDGRFLVFSANDGHGWRLWRVTSDGSAKPEALPGEGWYSAHFHGAQLYATRVDQPGIWKLSDPPERINSTLSPDYWADWTIAGDMLAYADFDDPKHPRIVLHPLKGGTEKSVDAPRIRQTPAGGVFALDPRTALPVYIRDLSDSDIAILHLAKK